MRCSSLVHIGILFILHSHRTAAQRVLYCTPVEDRYTLRMEVAGKAGEHYWIRVAKRLRSLKHRDALQATEEELFEIYDPRMTLVRTVPATTSDTTIKEYLVPGDYYFDRLLLASGRKSTSLSVKRYEPEGEQVKGGENVGHFPFSESGNNFLLVRSEDRRKILLLGFESRSDKNPRVHALLFDQDWRQLSYEVYEHPFFTQPAIQDDFTGYPIEHFSNGPVKLADDGQWLMASPSRTGRNFLLFHFCGSDNSFSYREILLPPSSEMEDVALSVNNETGDAYAGILSIFHYTSLKNVQVTHYSLTRGEFDFDSSYRFNTLTQGKVKDDNLVKENFIAVPGRGFMLLKEYGRVFENWYDREAYDNQWDPALLFAGYGIPDQKMVAPRMHDGYARTDRLVSIGGTPHERGDLNLFYLPAGRKDSSWSAMISKEQVTELNSPNLSYLVVPGKDKLFFLYNSFIANEDPYGSTTVIDQQGNPIQDEGMPFWRVKNILSFQQSRQISANEVAVPYDRLQRKGFAIIRF